MNARADARAVAAGLFFVAAGVLFLLHTTQVITLTGATLWPLLVIGVGLVLLAGALGGPSQSHHPR
jgi:hypothetical protein